MDEETKSRFTEYSMTSSVMRRNEQLTLLDDRFEKVAFHSELLIHQHTPALVFTWKYCTSQNDSRGRVL